MNNQELLDWFEALTPKQKQGIHDQWSDSRSATCSAAAQCEAVGLKHQKVEGAYSAGKKAGAFECRDIFRQNQDAPRTEMSCPASLPLRIVGEAEASWVEDSTGRAVIQTTDGAEEQHTAFLLWVVETANAADYKI